MQLLLGVLFFIWQVLLFLSDSEVLRLFRDAGRSVVPSLPWQPVKDDP